MAGERAFDVVGVGASCIDTVCRLPVFPEPTPARDKVRMQSQRRECGGQTATCLATCASFGLRAAYLGAVGDDDDGRMISPRARPRAASTWRTSRHGRQPSANATILLDASGERMVLWHRDPDLAYPAGPAAARASFRRRASCTSTMSTCPRRWRRRESPARRGVPVTCDIDHVTPGTRELLSLRDATRSSPRRCRST